MSSVNTNIDEYSTEDLLEILNLTSSASEYQITEACDSIISRVREQLNFNLVEFFQKVKKRLLEEEDDKTEEEDDEQISDWYENQYPAQNNQSQMNKVTERKQKVQTFDNGSQFPMNRERIGQPTTHPVAIAQGTMNPIQRNIVERTVCIDSQFRQNIYTATGAPPTVGEPAFNTDYTLDLTETLNNVVSMRLFSINIPSTWYAFSSDRGNICSVGAWGSGSPTPSKPNPYDTEGSWQTNPAGQIILPSGNYNTLLDLLETWRDLVVSQGIISAATDLVVDVSNSSGIASFTNTTAEAMYFLFWKEGQHSCVTSCYGRTYRNQNLAWDMGFRQQPEIPAFESSLPPSQQHEEIVIYIPANTTIYANVPGNVYGPTYFLLSIDDYNQNHLNKGLVSINQTETKLPVPSYFNPGASQIDGTSLISCSVDASNNPYVSSIQTEKSAPRKLTQAQIYTVNEIMANKNKQNDRALGPTITNILATIPLKNFISSAEGSTLRPSPIIEYSPTLQNNKRIYFGPVNIERMRVRLIDDRGNLVNLNDNNWSFTLLVDQLYQY